MKTISQFTNFAIAILLTFANLNVNAQNPPPQNFSVVPISSVASWEAPAGANPTGYKLFLADSLVAELANTTFNYTTECLQYGTDYAANLIAVYESGESEEVSFSWTSVYLKPVQQPFTQYSTGTSEILFQLANTQGCDNGGLPDGLISFNIYSNGELTANVPIAQGEEFVVFIINNLSPGLTSFCATAVYNLGVYGFPGETGESALSCEDVNIVYGMELPFTEDWSSGDFGTNNWNVDDSNWSVDQQTGNPYPSARFFNLPLLEEDYSSALKSDWINCTEMSEPDIFLEFDLKLNDINENRTEFIAIKIFDGTNYFWLDAVENSGSSDWQTHTYNISGLVAGKTFLLEFIAQGNSSANIDSWFIDNIIIYRECRPPPNFDIVIDTVGYDEYLLSFVFEMQNDSITELSWNNGINTETYQPNCSPLEIAIKWDSYMLSGYDGQNIDKARFFLNNKNLNSLVLSLYQGNNASNIIYSDTLDVNSLQIAWNEIDFAPGLSINGSEELWLSIKAEFDAGIFPFGLDQGPAVEGYGDLFRECNQSNWDLLSNVGSSNNWNISLYISENGKVKNLSQTDNQKGIDSFVGYNIYRSKNGGDYEFWSFVPPEIIGYPMSVSADGNTYCYKITAVWQGETDFCESEPARSIQNPEDDFVCIVLLDINEVKTIGSTEVFPNPATTTLNIKSESKLQTVSIFNLFGQKVGEFDVAHKNELQIDVSKLKSGVYLLKAFDGKATISSKFIIQ